jgi:hypothetical protein
MKRRASNRAISAVRGRKPFRATRGDHKARGRKPVATNKMLEFLARKKAFKAASGLTRAELKEGFERKVPKRKGSFNWCVDNLQNVRLLAKQQIRGGKYYLTAEGRREALRRLSAA